MSKNENLPEFLPGISIGLPVYNGEKFLQKRIESILNQTFQDFEIIISDNASTDSTEEICLQIKNKDKRIQYHKQLHNIGGMSNFSFVLNKAKHEFFVWAAVDDEWHTEFLKKNYEFLKLEKDFVGCVTKEDIINSKDDEINMKNFSKTRKNLRNKIYSKRPNLYPIKGNMLPPSMSSGGSRPISSRIVGSRSITRTGRAMRLPPKRPFGQRMTSGTRTCSSNSA